MARRDAGWWNPTGDSFWDSYYIVLWIVVAFFVLIVGAALANPRSWEPSKVEQDCTCKDP